jgi:hypothetical protein
MATTTSSSKPDPDSAARLRRLAISFAVDLSPYSRVEAIFTLAYAVQIVLGNWEDIKGDETVVEWNSLEPPARPKARRLSRPTLRH